MGVSGGGAARNTHNPLISQTEVKYISNPTIWLMECRAQAYLEKPYFQLSNILGI